MLLTCVMVAQKPGQCLLTSRIELVSAVDVQLQQFVGMQVTQGHHGCLGRGKLRSTSPQQLGELSIVCSVGG